MATYDAGTERSVSALARTAVAAEMWRQQIAARKYALEPLKAVLRREGRTQAWLARQLGERVAMQVSRRQLSDYLNGYARIPQRVLSAACWIAGAREADVMTRIADEEVLLQQPRKTSERRRTASA